MAYILYILLVCQLGCCAAGLSTSLDIYSGGWVELNLCGPVAEAWKEMVTH